MGEVIPLRRPAPAPPPVNAETLFRLARSLEPESPSLARTTYQAAIAIDPRHAHARVNFGRLLHESGELAAAVAEYRAALALDPSCSTAAFNLGVALEDLGRPDEASAAYARARSSPNPAARTLTSTYRDCWNGRNREPHCGISWRIGDWCGVACGEGRSGLAA